MGGQISHVTGMGPKYDCGCPARVTLVLDKTQTRSPLAIFVIALDVEAQNTRSISWVSLLGAVLAGGGPRRSMSIKEKRAKSLIGAF